MTEDRHTLRACNSRLHPGRPWPLDFKNTTTVEPRVSALQSPSAMDTSRIAVLLQPFVESPLHESQLHQILTFIDLLLRWYSRLNLTAIRDPATIVPAPF